MENIQKNFKQCDMCKIREATSLCHPCFSYYCNCCFKAVHERTENKEHKVVKIDYFVPIDTRCPEHKGDNITLFCIDEKGKIIYV